MERQITLGDVIVPAKVLRCDNDDYPVLSMTMHDGIVLQSDRFKKSLASIDQSNYKVVLRGQLVVGFPIDEGVIYVQNIAEAGIMSPAYGVWNIHSKEIMPEYLELCLHSPQSMDYYKNKLRGTTARRRSITTGDLLALPITLPSITEQKRRISLLKQATLLLNSQKQAMLKFDELVKSRFVEMFGEPSINSMGWPMKPFAETCTLLTGNTPPRAVKEYYDSYIEWIKSDNITTSSLYLTKAAEYLSEEGAKVGRVVHTGTILMTCIAGSLNTVGNVAIVDRDVAFNQQINAFIPQQYETMFLYVLLQLLKPRLHEAASSALKCILNKGNLESYAAIVPNMELQRQFSVFVAEVDKSKLAVKQSLEKLETLKKSLMQQYFG